MASRYLEKLTPIGEAVRRLVESVEPLREALVVPAWEATGMVLAEDIVSLADYPPRPRSAYDGYAVRSEDTPGRLRLIGEKPIGSVEAGRIGPGEAVYVTTGGYLPEGADAVVPEEEVRVEDGYIVVGEKVEKWANVDPPGYYARRGEKLLAKGTVITWPDVAGLLELGIATVKVYRRVRVSLLVTGSELFPPREPGAVAERVGRGEVAETTGSIVEWLIDTFTPWAKVVDKALVPDDVGVMEWYLDRMLDYSDLVIMTGGTGPSTIDGFYQLREKTGAKLLFRGIRARGGKPTSAMLLRGKPVIALSGHPLSALHGFIRIVEPLLRHMSNVAVPQARPMAVARLAEPYEVPRARPVKVRLELRDGELWATPLPKRDQLSSVTTGFLRADAIALLDEGRHERGEHVTVLLLRTPWRPHLQGF